MTVVDLPRRIWRHPRSDLRPSSRLSPLYPAAVRGLPVLGDKGSPPQAGGTPTASGAGIRVPVRRQRGGRELDPATQG